MQRVERVPLVERSWALGRELLQSVKWGGFAMTTLWGCPTRKYHSWLSLWRGFMRYELLPQMQEELLLREGHFLLTTQYFHGQLVWEGYRYLQQLRVGPGWHWVYQVGELHIEKSLHLHPQAPLWVLRYAFSGPVLFRWTPLWAVRPWHTLRTEPIEVLRKGERLLLPEEITLHYEVSPTPRFVPCSYPYEGVFYPAEVERGYAAVEVLSAAECWEWRLHRAGEITILLSPEPLTRALCP